MSKWFLIVMSIACLASFIALWVRMEGRREIKRLEDGNLTADDFDIIE